MTTITKINNIAVIAKHVVIAVVFIVFSSNNEQWSDFL